MKECELEAFLDDETKDAERLIDLHEREGDTRTAAFHDGRLSEVQRVLAKMQEIAMTNERKNITQPSDWWDAFEQEAKKAGVSLSKWIGDACLDKLPAKVLRQLSERQPANRPKKKAEDQ